MITPLQVGLPGGGWLSLGASGALFSGPVRDLSYGPRQIGPENRAPGAMPRYFGRAGGRSRRPLDEFEPCPAVSPCVNLPSSQSVLFPNLEALFSSTVAATTSGREVPMSHSSQLAVSLERCS